jgi:hypothetical protein
MSSSLSAPTSTAAAPFAALAGPAPGVWGCDPPPPPRGLVNDVKNENASLTRDIWAGVMSEGYVAPGKGVGRAVEMGDCWGEPSIASRGGRSSSESSPALAAAVEVVGGGMGTEVDPVPGAAARQTRVNFGVYWQRGEKTNRKEEAYLCQSPLRAPDLCPPSQLEQELELEPATQDEVSNGQS